MDVEKKRSEDIGAYWITGVSGRRLASPVATSTGQPAQGPDGWKFCPQCGAILRINAEMCTRCGVLQPRAKACVLPSGRSERNRIVAALMAIFLGTVGAHKFYIGDSTAGRRYIVLSLMSLGIVPGILGILDGIHYITMTDQAFAEEFA
jgi:TM2 domain-containing membrane protein YozV/ribosomal protein L40E